MSSITEHFRYTPIDPAQKEFRLLHLTPRCTTTSEDDTSLQQPNRPISCILEKTSLRASPKYSALSYRWGGTGRQILVNDKPFTVTDKLEIALQHLQKNSEPLTLWVDAICINQQDTEEKMQQVQQMTDIYRNASQVLIWLGPAADGSDQVIDSLQLISQVFQRQDLRNYMKSLEDMESLKGASSWKARADLLTKVINDLEAQGGYPKDLHAISTLETEFKNLDSPFLDTFPAAQYRKLCHREWWTRTWVIQELCVPEKPIFVCGKKMITYSELSKCARFFKEYWTSDFQKRKRDRNSNEEPDPTLILSTSSSPADVMMSFRSSYQNSKGECTLYTLLRNICNKATIDAEDQRDKIYSLLGFVSDKDTLNIRVDYGKNYSCEDVYIDTSRALINQGYLDLLFLRQTSKSPDLPSWVCDWGAEIHEPWGNSWGVNPFTASGSSAPEVHTYTTNNGQHIASIRSKLIDTISSLASPVPKIDPDSDTSDALSFFISETRRILSPLSDEDMAAVLAGGIEYTDWDYKSGTMFKYFDKKSSTKLGCCRATSKSTEGLKLLERWLPVKKEFEELRSLEEIQITDETKGRWKVLLPLIDGLQEMKSGTTGNIMVYYLQAVENNLQRKAFCTQNGYKGLVPADAEVGDLLCVFLGADLPSVVRKVAGGRYRLVGEAYIQGFMDGELMEVAGDTVALELC